MQSPTRKIPTRYKLTGKRYMYRAAVGKSRRGDSASAAVTNTISPPMNWNIAIVMQVLWALSANHDLKWFDKNPPNSHDSASGARYGNCTTVFKEAGRIVAWAYFEIYHTSDGNFAENLEPAHCYGLALDQL